jgi:hypothetical protein
MNKKRFSLPLLALALALPLLSGCDEKAAPVPLAFGSLYDSSLSDTAHFQKLDAYSDLKSKMGDENQNFVLVVLPKDLGCTCWSRFCATINLYQSRKNLQIFSISASQFDDSSLDKYGLSVDSHLATIAIVEGGKVKYQQTADGTNDSFAKDYDVFSKWMDARLSLSDMLYLSKSQMDGLYAGTTPFTIGFVRTSCGDCSYVANHLLKEYNASKRNRSYLFDLDVEGVRYYNGAEPKDENEATADEKAAYAQYNAFKRDYGLASTYTADFGYGAGCVPMWVHCNPAANTEGEPWGAIDDADVYDNDTISLVAGQYKITESFFDDARQSKLPFLDDADALRKGGVAQTNLTSVELSQDSVDVYDMGGSKYYAWNHAAAALYHDPLLKAFFAKYVAME